jgi:hypothetical protein
MEKTQFLLTQTYQKYQDATLYMSEEMGLINEYILKKHNVYFNNYLSMQPQGLETLINDLDEKVKLMSDLIKMECSKEVFTRQLLYDNFFEFDLAFSDRLQKLKNWRIQNDNLFQEIKNYVEKP